MSDLVSAVASALVHRYSDQAFAVAFEQAARADDLGSANTWYDIAYKVSEINRARVAAILDPDMPVAMLHMSK